MTAASIKLYFGWNSPGGWPHLSVPFERDTVFPMAHHFSVPERTAYRPGAAAIFQQMSLLARSNDAVNFAQGIPDPVYDDLWVRALRNAVAPGSFQYTASQGIPELREAIASEYAVRDSEVIITSGCTEGLQAALAAFTVQGRSHLIYVEPFYAMYPGMASLHRLSSTCVPLAASSDRMHFDVDAIIERMRRHAGAITLLNSPHNPTGATITVAQWSALADAAEETGGVLLVDDAYHDFVFDGEQPPWHEFVQRGVLVACGAASKGLAATGLRVGWVVAPTALVELIDDAHMHLSYCTPLFIQHATVQVWNDVFPQRAAATRADYAARAESLTRTLRAIGASVSPPHGGFFVCAQLPEHMLAGHGSGIEQAKYLTHHYGFTPLPLDSFVATGSSAPWLRFAICTSDEVFQDGLTLLAEATNEG